MKRKLELDEIINLIEFFNDGKSLEDIEKEFKIKKNVIEVYVNHFRQNLLPFYFASAFQDLTLLEKPIEVKLFELLIIEKNRRNYDSNKILFLGMANLAKYFWCAIKSYFQSKKEEEMYFVAYLLDRISYANKLGYNKKLPKSPVELLEIGNEINIDDIEKLLEDKNRNHSNAKIIYTAAQFVENGKKKLIFNPNLSKDEEFMIGLDLQDVEIVDAEKHPKILGKMIELDIGKHYPSIRWNFNYENYTIVGVPDGITDDFVYEFKTTGSEFLLHFVKPVPFAQANVYGYFFNRNKKRVQIHI